jgi:acyl-CoA thioesterase-2
MAAWIRVTAPLDGDDLLHRCWLAYLSDDLPTDAVSSLLARHGRERAFGASLDHTIWFHRPFRADEWHLHDFTCHGYVGARGLSVGHVFSASGAHVATVGQEVLLRESATTR